MMRLTARQHLSPSERRAMRQLRADAAERAARYVETYRNWKIEVAGADYIARVENATKYVALNPSFPSMHPAGNTLEEARAMIDDQHKHPVRYA